MSLTRYTIEGSEDWDVMALRSTDHFNQLSFGPFIAWHNCRFALGATTVLSTGQEQDVPVIMDRRSTFDIVDPESAVTPLLFKGKYEQGKMELAKPFNPVDHFFQTRSSIAHLSYHGRLLFLNTRGELRWVDEMHGVDRLLYAFPHAFGPFEDNSKNALHPVSGALFERTGYIWAIIASSAKTRSEEDRQPSRMVRFEIEQRDLTNGTAPVLVSIASFPLLDMDEYSINASSVLVMPQARHENKIELIYEDPEFNQVRHMSIDLTNPLNPVQTFCGYIHNVVRETGDLRSALTHGCAAGYQVYQPFIYVNSLTINKAEQALYVTFTAYSIDSVPIEVDAKRALSWVELYYPVKVDGMLSTMPVPDLLTVTSSPTGVEHKFVVSLHDPGYADELARLQDRLDSLNNLV